MPDIFISYSRNDSQQAEQLADVLTSAGLPCWIDRHGIDAATSWSAEIVEAINRCKAFIVLLSRQSVDSHNVIKEVALASEKRKKILPLELEPVTLPRELEYPLAGIQRTSMSNIDAIIRALDKIGLAATGAPRAPTIVKELSGKKSLMILPFEDFSPTRDNEWFTDGMASELINALSHVKSLRVIDWNTSKLFKERKVKTIDLARELEARYFLEGQVRKFGEQIKISITLLDIETGDHLWNDSFKGTMQDVFEIQEQVATNVVEALKIHLATAEEKKLRDRGTASPEAYELSLKATEYYSRHTREGYRLAISLLTEASRIDPDYANALRFKAYVLAELFRGYERDPTHLDEAELLAKRALALKPDLWQAYDALSNVYRLQGKLAEAEHAVKEFVRHAPENNLSHFALGFFYMETNQPALAIEPFEMSLALKPDHLGDYVNLAIVSDQAGDQERMVKWSRAGLPYYERRLRLTPDDEHAVVMYADLLQRVGETDRALETLAPMLGKVADASSLYNLACIFARLGDSSSALAALRRAVDAGFAHVEVFRNDPDLAPLAAIEEFQELLKTMGAKQSV